MRFKGLPIVIVGALLLVGSSASAQVRLSTPRAESVPDVYVVTSGDTLWDIASQFFGDPYEWPRIWSYNPAITNPHW
ncbi:MAG: LysM peptidoglycan-binding domain-containing protein, partial [Sandaracinaceae bacterium]|nr:LysM peptidoglycan-binding domain-containing protein [Sandaracinaceae bacterium]